ncbi:RHS repeat-associated core domain-containing protein [Streptomyces sp. NPDC058773]|uniref:RHS repeat-associated core domain-containing protein n=1 Tax=Streptomyces sp. NPDC058773 TaxID=3346632 RepID=UPI0036CDF492
MGVVLPDWADELLDLIGVSWPNVDEDDYREMANAMREFADDIDEGANEAHTAIQSLVGSAGGSVAVEALNAHWGKINGKHLKGLAECGRMAGTAMDGVAVLIEGAKIGALVQLGILAAEVIAAQAAAPFTLGLSELGAMGATQATRVILKRLFKEVCQQVAEQIVSIALTPVEEALGAMVGDLVVQLGANALGVQDGVDLGHTAKAGKDGFTQGVQNAKDSAKPANGVSMGLLSAGGGSGSGGGGSGFRFDQGEHDGVVAGLERAGGTFRNKAGGKLGRARGHHGRTRGKDAIADAANVMLDKVMDGIEDAVKKTAKHMDDGMARGVKQMAKNHHDNDRALSDHFTGLGKIGKKDPKSPNDGARTSLNSSVKDRNNSRDQLGRNHPNNNTRTDKAINGCGDPVDVATGRVFLGGSDVTLFGKLPLELTRKFESSYRVGRHLGPSWASTLDQRLELDDQGVVFVTDDGMLLSYDIPEPGQHALPQHGPRWTLTRTPREDWAVHDPDTGLTRYFSDAPQAAGLALLDEVTDRNGNHITFDYDDTTGAPLSVRHSCGYQLRLSSNERGQVSAVHLAGVAEDGSDLLLVAYEHDAHGNLTSVTGSCGTPTRFEYGDFHRMTAWTDTNGSRYEYTYDQDSRCTAQGGLDGHLSYRYSYSTPDPDTGHRTTQATNSLGQTTRYLVNERLQVIAETDPAGATRRTTYNALDRVTSTTDPLGRTTIYEYDDQGHLLTVTQPDGTAAYMEYDELGLPCVITDAAGATWRQKHDDRGNRLAFTDGCGATTRYTRDNRGNLVSITDPTGSAVHASWNAAGLPLTVVDAAGNATLRSYDGFGRVVETTEATGETTRYSWTLEGLPASCEHPDGTEESWTYDGEGNCLSHTDTAGHITHFEYSHFDQLVARTDADGARYEFAHDTELRLQKVTNPQGLTWVYQYDATGRLVAETDFDQRTQTYAYAPDGELIARTTALGETITYTHDAFGRLAEKHVGNEITSYEYNAVGHLMSVSNDDAVLEFARDALGRVTVESVNGRKLTSVYDANGRRTRRTTPSGAVSVWTYNSAGAPVSLTASGNSITFQHDASGRETERRMGQSVSMSTAWDSVGRLAEQALSTPQHRHSRRYNYHPDGHLFSVHDQSAGERQYSVDAAGRVTSVRADNWTESYAYDSAGNQVHATWPTRHPGSAAQGPRSYEGTRLTDAGRFRYEYDPQGRVVLRQKTRLSRKPDTWHYEWDAEDRLTQVTTPDGTVWRYRYDPLGRRIAKERMAPDGNGHVERVDFTWDGYTLVEQTATSSVQPHAVTLTWDYQGTRLLAQTERKSLAHAPQQEIDHRFYAIITDLIGTPTELVAPSGDVAWRTRSTLWGSTTWNAEATAYTPLRFPGQYFDAETGFHYNYFRHYDPETARYTSPDPLGLDPAPNPTTYVNNPHTSSDPMGLAPCMQSLEDMAAKINNVITNPRSRKAQTVAAIHVETPHGPVIVVAGTSKSKLTPAQRKLAEELGAFPLPNEHYLPPTDKGVRGGHSEQNILHFLNRMGSDWSPTHGAASRSVCTDICYPVVRAGGALMHGPVHEEDVGHQGRSTKQRHFYWPGRHTPQ